MKLTITVYSVDGSISASCAVSVREPDFKDQEYVDLGLPSGLKWATCNVGATRPEEYGDHFAWGETKPKSDYSWATYKWCKGSDNNLTKYCPSDMADYWGGSGSPDNKLQLDLKDDAAWVNWGGNWHMPTKARLERTYR